MNSSFTHADYDHRISNALLAAGLVSREKMTIALQTKVITGEQIGQVLVRLGIVSEFDLARVLADENNIEYIDMESYGHPGAEAMSMFNKQFCLYHSFLPLSLEGQVIRVLVGNANIEDVRQIIMQQKGLICEVAQGEFSKVQQAIQHFYFFMNNPVEELFNREVKKLAQDIDQVLSPDTLINHMLHLAIKMRASDIHIQPEQLSIRLMFRIDGFMRSIVSLPSSLKRVVLALKILANMDASDAMRPQDGSFSTSILESPVDVRVSTIITEYGENMVMRLLPSGVHVKGLSQLGFHHEDIIRISRLFAHPHGIMLMTGPTGSGKSTTLHAGLRCEGMEGKNIVTVEDPIEYKLPVINQTQVNRKAGYLFSTAIRHFLRHDPDVMMVGEIRDHETAEAAITAAETGHLVLSTLHTNTAMGSISRLLALGIPANLIAETFIGAINQRLARKICPHCSTPYTPAPEEQNCFNTPVETLYYGKGCNECLGSGYLGRLPLYEILEVSTQLKHMIEAEASQQQLHQQLKDDDFISIEEMALQRVQAGETTLAEVQRVLGHHLKG